MEPRSALKKEEKKEVTVSSVLLSLLTIVVMLLFVGVVTMTAWNYSLPHVSSLGHINLTQSVALLILVRILSGMVSCGNTVLVMAA